MVGTVKVSLELSLIENVELTRSGDECAFARLIDSTSATVTSIALAIVRDIDNAQDVAQQVYIKVWEQINTLKNTASFLPWLRQTTRNTAFNFLRDNKVSRTISGEAAEQLLNEYSDLSQDQDELLQRSQQGEIISCFVDALPSEDREVILLYYREGESSKRVAELLSLSESNVRKKLSRTRARLKSSMLSRCGDLLLSTAPAVGFGSIVISSITASSPVAAVTLTSASTSQAVSLLAKVWLLLGGAMLGALGAIGGILLGSKLQLRTIDDPIFKLRLISRRNKFIIFTVLFGIAFAISYEFTRGWIAPVFCYSVFAISLIYFIISNNKMVISYHHSTLENTKEKRVYRRRTSIFGIVGLIGGLSMGYTGLIWGLLDSGRLAF
jgi:RNA polymerase sigma factor (sigma-70 family)